MNHICIILKKNSKKELNKIKYKEFRIYYLSDDYRFYIKLKKLLDRNIIIRNLGNLFDTTLQEIKYETVEILSRLNEVNDSFEWWGGQVASRNTQTTAMMLNIVYLFCTKKIIEKADKNIALIIDDLSLIDCVKLLCTERNIDFVKTYMGFCIYIWKLRDILVKYVKIIRFIYISIKLKILAKTISNKIESRLDASKKKILLRTWVTQGNFDANDNCNERNFGNLSSWLKQQGYEIIKIPMFFNITSKIRKIYRILDKQKEVFFLSSLHVSAFDFVKVINNGLKTSNVKINSCRINNVEVAPIIQDAIKKSAVDNSLFELNLDGYALKYFKEKRIAIDRLIYPFENNASEKQFIIMTRKYLPNAKVIGYQHTTFFPNQLAYHLGRTEQKYHPLPDKIICSGKAYISKFTGANFPDEIVEEGPNLRFGSVYLNLIKNNFSYKKKLLLPLTFSHDLAFETFYKVKEALEGTDDFVIYVRSHPLLNKRRIKNFLDDIGLKNYENADGKIIQEWLKDMFAMITAGGSITTLEAAAMGIPVIRVVSDNAFHFDSLSYDKYPLKTINSAKEIKDQLKEIEKIYENEKDLFDKIGKKIKQKYFCKPLEENLKTFIS